MRKFIEFLERNNAWKGFERNFTEQKKNVGDYKDTCKSFASVELEMAFMWDDTEEGFDYWQRLNNKWVKENKSLKEKLLSDD